MGKSRRIIFTVEIESGETINELKEVIRYQVGNPPFTVIKQIQANVITNAAKKGKK